MDDPEDDSGHLNPNDRNVGVHDTSLDLLEQQQAREQARLLNRFRELRTMQQRQQEQLMMQQQAQLELLKEEQERVQNMLKTQRQQQWGAGTIKPPTLPSKSPTKTSPKHVAVKNLLNTIPVPSLNTQNGTSILNKQSSLPRPVIYENQTEPDADNYTNPDLFSNPGSCDQLEEGVFNAYDTGSESDPSSAQQLAVQTLLKSASPETLRAMFSMIPRAKLLECDPSLSPRGKILEALGGVSPRSKTRQANMGLSPKAREVPPSPRTRLQRSPSPRSSGSVITELEKRAVPTNGVGNVNTYIPEPASPKTLGKGTKMEDKLLPQDIKRHLFYEDDNYSVDSEIVGALQKLSVNNGIRFDNYMPPNDVPGDTEKGPPQQKEDRLEHDSELSPRTTTTRTDLLIDDRPIKPGLAGKKTFEQLLEEQLRAEEEKIMEEESEVPVDSPRDKKKPFLRRGQGLARFMGNKANRETSGKSKKTDPKSKQVEKTVPKENKPKKAEPSNGSLSNTAKSNQVSKPVKSKPSQQVPKSISSQSSNPTVPLQTLKLIPNKNSAKPQSSSTLNQQKSSSAHNSETNSNNSAGLAGRADAFKVPAIPPPVKESKILLEKEKAEMFDPFDDDSSFAAGVRERIANEGKEQEELDEFELLEDFADNSSFCSSSSIFTKLMQVDQKKNPSEALAGLKTVIEARKASHQNKQQAKQCVEPPNEAGKDKKLIEENDEDSSTDTLTDSDSSISSDSEFNDADIKFLTAKILEQQQQHQQKQTQDNSTPTDCDNPPIHSKSLTRKIASRDGVAPVTEVRQNNNIVSSSTTEMRSLLNRLSSSKGPHLNTLLQKDLVKSTNESSKDGGNSNDKEDDDERSESEESTSEESSDEDEGKKEDVYVNDFDDEEEWTESAPTAKTKAEVVGDKNSETKTPSSPPTSELVARRFPNLSQQQEERQKKRQEAEKLQATKASDGIQSKILRDKLAELEVEIERFRNENSVLDNLRKEREEGLAKLKKEISDFEKEKSEELKRLEEFKNQEMKKLKHERKMFEKYQKTVRSMPDKKDREEIEMLKNQLSDLQEEMKRKEGRWTASQSRLKDKLELVELENKELKEEIKLLEKKRLEWMQKEAASQKAQVNGHQSFPRSSTPTKETEQDKPNLNNNHISPPRSQVPTQKKSVANQLKLQSASKSLSLTTDSIPSLQQSTSDPQPRSQPTKITKSAEISNDSSSTNSSSSIAPRKFTNKLLSDHPTIDKGNKQYEESQHSDGKVERIYRNGAREILFSNGTCKEISPDGQSIVVSFFNGDIKQIYPDKRVVYYYADAQTSHTTYPDNLEVLLFQNGQIEKHYPDGTKEITFPDQTVKYLFPNGSEESIFPDGTFIRIDVNGDKTLEFPNGQREIHNAQFKRREYPDGTVKTVYPDGRQETRYSTGRIRLKDKDGNVIMDRIC